MIPWKVALEYRLLRVKTKLAGGLLKVLILGLLKTSTFVIVYSIDWLLRAIITSVLFICSNLVKNPSSLCFSSIVISTSNCSVSVSSFCSDRLLTPSNSTRNTLK
jgi:hypothetical protein